MNILLELRRPCFLTLALATLPMDLRAEWRPEIDRASDRIKEV